MLPFFPRPSRADLGFVRSLATAPIYILYQFGLPVVAAFSETSCSF